MPDEKLRSKVKELLPLTVKGKALHFLHPLHGSKSKELVVYRGHGAENSKQQVASTSRDFSNALHFSDYVRPRMTAFTITPRSPAIDMDRYLQKKLKGKAYPHAHEQEVVVLRGKNVKSLTVESQNLTPALFASKSPAKPKAKVAAKGGVKGKGGGKGGGGWRTVRGKKVYLGGDGKVYVGAAAGKQYAKEKK